MGWASFLSDEEATYKYFKRMCREYKRNGVYVCEMDLRSIVGWWALACVMAAIMAIITASFLPGAIGTVMSFVVILTAPPIFGIYKMLSMPSVRLERGRLIIKKKDKETSLDITSITARYRLAYRSSNLYIMIEGGATLNEKQVFYTPYYEGAAFVCLINCLKENELEKIENLTLDEFYSLYNFLKYL